LRKSLIHNSVAIATEFSPPIAIKYYCCGFTTLVTLAQCMNMKKEKNDPSIEQKNTSQITVINTLP
jgi:hypothetical protein